MTTRRAGFTLLELTVALTVTGVVILAAHEVVGAVTDATARARAAGAPIRSSVAARAQLEAWLRSADLLGGAAALRGEHRTTDGIAADELTLAVRDGGALRPGPHRIRLWVDRDPLSDRRGLLAELIALDDGAASPETLVVAPSATGLSLRYLAPVDGKETWLAEWRSNQDLPLAIELRLFGTSRTRLGEPAALGGLPELLELPLLVPVTRERW